MSVMLPGSCVSDIDLSLEKLTYTDQTFLCLNDLPLVKVRTSGFLWSDSALRSVLHHVNWKDVIHFSHRLQHEVFDTEGGAMVSFLTQ